MGQDPNEIFTIPFTDRHNTNKNTPGGCQSSYEWHLALLSSSFFLLLHFFSFVRFLWLFMKFMDGLARSIDLAKNGRRWVPTLYKSFDEQTPTPFPNRTDAQDPAFHARTSSSLSQRDGRTDRSRLCLRIPIALRVRCAGSSPRIILSSEYH